MSLFKCLLIYGVVFIVYTSPNQANEQDRLKRFVILEDNVSNESKGYYNDNLHSNGEDEIAKIAQPGDIVFDVGAHKGEWSINLLKHQPKVTIYAFEPLPMLQDILKANFEGYDVKKCALALSDTGSRREIIYYSEYPGMSTLHPRRDVEKMLDMSPSTMTIQTERLDVFAKQNNIKAIQILKIDTEGNEWNVLKGAEKLLKAGKISFIQFEYSGCYLDSKTTLKQVYDYLTNFGYSIYRITPQGLVAITKWKPQLENYTYSNYLAVTPISH